MRPSSAFVLVSISFMGGILLGSVWYTETLWLYIAAAFFVVLFALGRRHIRVGALCGFALVFGIYHMQASSMVENSFMGWFDEKQDFEAVVVEDIDTRTDRQLLTVEPVGYSQRVLITTTKFGKFFYGDKVWVRGKVVEPAVFDDFDYRGYLKRHNVYAVMRYPKIITLKTSQANVFKYQLLKIKSWAANELSSKLSEPQGSLLLGLLIGAKRSLPQDVADAFASTGTSHIVAVSGFNISIIVVGLGFLAYVFGRRIGFWVSFFSIVAFVVIAGGGSSVIRAGVMGVLLLLSFNIGRLYSITPSLCLAASVMILLNPRVLYWDVGFQLSFAATLGIVYGVPVLEALTPRVKPWFGLKTLVLVTLCATVATLPFILLNFERLSTVSLVANILVVPMIPMVMLLGAGVLLPFFGTGFAFVSNFLLQYILAITKWFSVLPFASIEVGVSIPTFCAMLLGLVCAYVLLRLWGRKITRKPNAVLDAMSVT